MPFILRSKTSTNSYSGSAPYDFTINVPSGVQDGDILFALISAYSPSPNHYMDVVPTGWTLIGRSTLTIYEEVYLYFKIASSEPSSYTWSYESRVYWRGVIVAYPSGSFNVSSIGDLTYSNLNYTGFDNTICRASSINIEINSPLLFFGVAEHNPDVITFTKPTVPNTNWIEDEDAGDTTTDFYQTVCSMLWSGSGDTGTVDATISVSTVRKHAFLVGLNPADLPTVITYDATDVSAVSATGNGEVTFDGGSTVIERGFVWSTSANPTILDSKVVVSGTIGVFSGSITGLSAGITYHYRAYATNGVGTAYGTDYTISTVLSFPTVATLAVTDIGSSAATANGDVLDAGGGTILERGFAWGTGPNPTITADSKVVVSGTLGVFTGPLVGLTSSVLYHVRAYAINEAGIAYGADVFFTSLESGMGGGGDGGGAEPVAVGTVYSPDDEAGVVYAVDVTTGNLLLFYKKIDPLPYSPTDSARWNDGFDLPYTASALALALSAEDDEYDRYRAWIYEFISNSVADSLRNMAINKNVR